MTMDPNLVTFEPSDDDERLKIKESRESWSEYELQNGDVIRVRPVVVDVFKSTKIKDPNGNPLLSLKTQLIVDYQAKIKIKTPSTSRKKK